MKRSKLFRVPYCDDCTSPTAYQYVPSLFPATIPCHPHSRWVQSRFFLLSWLSCFFLVSHLSFWDGPLGVVPPHTYFCLVTTITQQWESGSLAGSWRVSVELRYQQPHPYLLFHGDGLAFLCFLSQVPHQHISIHANDGEHLDTK